MTRMTARYSGRCAVCGEHIRAGETIEYDRAQGGARHPGCVPYTPQPEDIYISIGEGYGGAPFRVGEVVRNPKNGHPPLPVFTDAERAAHERETTPYVYVLHATQTYYREDGMSFGVGDESGYIYSAYCRPATEEESATLRAEEQRQQERRQAQRELDVLAKRALTDGEYPAEAHPAEPVRVLLDTRTIYGGGDRWLIASGEVWHCVGNGGDSDDWSRNNYGREIAYRLPDPDGALAAELERISAVLSAKQEAHV